MSQETELVQRMDRLEAQIAPIAESAKALGELREELTPRVNEAVAALIAELADVEADFQLEDLMYLAKNAMRNVRNLNFTLDQLKNLIDFLVIAEPVMKTTVPQVIFYLDELEQKGVFRILNLGLEVLKRIGSDYSSEQLQQIGDGMVRLVGVLHKLVAPEALDLLEKAADLPASADVAGAKPVGLFGLMGALSDPKMKAGVGVALELTKGLSELREA
ncbi:MAG: DUF1641 domain-containing protein [Desulfobacteraceae bacterium]|jgi:uncharacterized protein YjgD (DUF1641 family)